MNNLSAHQQPTSASLTQQFCLRWHNHQTSLLTSLPLLLDQSHLTDVTLSAEGRTIRAHRVVLSACSTFFSELFRTMEPPFHPVIVIPGASFGAVVALLTFMYSGEVNVFQDQIPNLLSLAETLGIKGLADFSGNVPKRSSSNRETPVQRECDVSSRPSPSPPPTVPSSNTSQPSLPTSPIKIPHPLENIFAKSFQFCPSMITNPLNFSPSAISRGAELFARFQRQNSQQEKMMVGDESSNIDENGNTKNCLNIEMKGRKSKTADMRKIDKIAESLRTASSAATKNSPFIDHQEHISKQIIVQNTSATSPMLMKSPPPPPPSFSGLAHHFDESKDFNTMPNASPVSMATISAQPHSGLSGTNATNIDKSILTSGTPTSTAATSCLTQKPSNSKLYATCFICHKQLSNQYNLRVHLETHQNVRYACSVCTHVSRSKDALRKHVSYRHPGAPSPCDSESKRKRSRTSTSAALAQQQQQYQQQQLQQQQQQKLNLSQSQSQSPIVPAIKSEIINDLSMSSSTHAIPVGPNQSQIFAHFQSPLTNVTVTSPTSPSSTSSSPSCRTSTSGLEISINSGTECASPASQTKCNE